jgi:hypothetical protein
MVSQPPAPGESAAVGDSKSLRPILGQITTESSESGQRIDWFVSRSGEALWMTIAVSGDFDSAGRDDWCFVRSTSDSDHTGASQ